MAYTPQITDALCHATAPDFTKKAWTFTWAAGAGATAWAAATAAIRWTAPEAGVVLGVEASYRATGGTHSTSTIDCMIGGVSCLSALVDVSGAAGVKAGTVNAAADDIAADDVMTINFAESGGSSPTLTDVTIVVYYRTAVAGE